jgi:hypothetical protein
LGEGDDGVTVVGAREGKLIDIDDEDDEVDVGANPVEITPAEKLKMLLRQMEVEVRDTTPAPPMVAARSIPRSESHVVPTPSAARGGWREGRRRGLEQIGQEERRSVPSSPEVPHRDEREEEEESPPTPPHRITNPYLYSSRRTSDDRESRLQEPGQRGNANWPLRASDSHSTCTACSTDIIPSGRSPR